jgi:phage terminase large subunit
MRTYDFSNLPDVINESFYPYLFDEAFVSVFWGSGSSGKSWFIAAKLLYRMISEANQVIHNIIVLRKYEPSVEKSAWVLVNNTINAWGLRKRFNRREKPMRLTFKDNGATFIFMGLDDPEKIKSIENVTAIWMEETTEFTYEDYMQLLIRMRGACSTYFQLCASFNPVDKMCWTYREWYDKDRFTYEKTCHIDIKDSAGNPIVFDYRITVMHSDYTMNRFLPNPVRAQLENLINMDLTYYIIYAKGDYADIKNKIYTNVAKINEIPDDIEWDYHCAGFDFGTTDPTVLLEIFGKGFDVYFKQIYYIAGKTVLDAKKFMTDNDFPTDLEIYCDSENPDGITTLKDDSIEYKGTKLKAFNAIPCVKGHGSVKAGIDYLRAFRVFIRSRDIDTWNDFFMYKWKEDKNGNVLNEPVEGNDHACAAGRYGVHGNYRIGNVTAHCYILDNIFGN